MDREFEATIDSEGHLDIPAEVRERHGLTNGARVRIEEQGNRVVLEAISDDKVGSLDDLIGFLGSDSKVVERLLEERKKDIEKEDRRYRS